jgi:hypothetical protein
MTTLVDKVIAICRSLDRGALPHALGGALALAYATEEPRGTRDIAVNVFVGSDRAASSFAALPEPVRWTEADVEAAKRDGQVRLWWDDTPVDIFFAETPFHHEANGRCRSVPFADVVVRVLSAEDLAVFKALFDRPKDWLDLATMAEARAVDLGVAADRLTELLDDDHRVARLRSLGQSG